MEFWLTSLIVVASPGPGAVYTVAAGLGGGRRAALVAALGCTLGIVPHLLAALTGLAAVFQTSPLAFAALRMAGVVVLLLMAWQSLRNDTLLGGASARRSPGAVLREAVVLNLPNPKLSLFFLAFLPLFVPAGTEAPTRLMLGLGGIFMLLTLAVFAAYGLLAAGLRDTLASTRARAWIRRGFALAFVGLALKLALTTP